MSALGIASLVGTNAPKIGNFAKGIGDFLGIGGGAGSRRNKKREALAGVGFNLVKTPSRTLGTGWNIDDWDDQGLDNLMSLYSEFGQTAVRAHNAQALDGRRASSIASLRRDIQKFSENLNGSQMMASVSGSDTGAGLFSLKNITGMIIGAGALVGGYFLLIPKGKR